MLAAGVKLARCSGLTVGPAEFTLDDVITASGVSRTSARRIWPTRESFFEDLLCEVAMLAASHQHDSSTLKLCHEIVLAHASDADDVDRRRLIMLEVIRRGLENNYQIVMNAPAWQTLLLTSGHSMRMPGMETKRRMRAAVERGGEDFICSMATYYGRLMSVLGYRLKSGQDSDLNLFAVLGAALVEGIATRNFVNPRLTTTSIPGPDTVEGVAPLWSPAAIGFLALFDQFMEPNPHYDGASNTATMPTTPQEG